MQRLRWCRYEIESYLLLEAPLQRFIEGRMGGVDAAAIAVADLHSRLAFIAGKDESDPLVKRFFQSEPMSKTLLPQIMTAAGMDASKRDYFEIAAQFKPEEVHPEIVERLNQMKQAFGVAGVAHV